MAETKKESPLPEEEIAKLVEEHMGWATSIAKSVARAWNLDWQLDGLDGGAYEGLVFCAQRFDPARGVPFKGYARKRIHEAATEQARKSKSWKQGVGCDSEEERQAREISATLFDMFPELREGILPKNADTGGDDEALRRSVRQLISGASLIAAFQDSGRDNPEIAVEYKELLAVIAQLDAVHQNILFAVYWRGQSMRGLASEWEIDELAVIREHKEILEHLSTAVENKSKRVPIKIRRALRPVAQRLRKDGDPGPFDRFTTAALVLMLLTSLLTSSGKAVPLAELFMTSV